ncbi:MAG: SUMF1/EgtB/PvdO family nonheme iron enzyme [Tepidisphaeraceae bacterium]
MIDVRRRLLGWVVLLGIVAAPACLLADAPEVAKDSIPGQLVTFDMIKVPAGKVTVKTVDGKTQEVDIKPVWIGKTEVTWDEYDVFMFQLDVNEKDKAAGTEAKSRPSKPYGAPDFGFGHKGLPAMCITAHSADMYCQWLSKKTGKKYRLATEAEWEYACRAGRTGDAKLTPDEMGKAGWYYDNSEDKAHPVAKKAANAWGFFDMLGNVREWVTGLDGKPITAGGSWDDDAENIGCHVRQQQKPEWNKTDPQSPKSRWWLSDGSMIGFRIVRED